MKFRRNLLVTLFLLLYIHCAGAEEHLAEILNHPKTQVAPLGSTVIFNCHMIGDGFWKINGSSVFSVDYDDFPGFDFWYEEVESNPKEVNLTISVVVSLEYNSTRIRCEGSASYTDQVAVSDTALLIAASPPTPPNPTANVVNATVIQLTWPVPFTHDGFEVDHYTVTSEKQNTGDINAVDVDDNEYVLYKMGGIAEQCEEIICTVTASNSIGESSGMQISTGFPTVPAALAPSISPDVTFNTAETPKVVVSFELPETCVFQTSWYTIVVEEDDSNGVQVVYGPHSFTGRDHVTVEQDISDGLERGRNYSVTVWVESLAGRSPNTFVGFVVDVSAEDADKSAVNDGDHETSSVEHGGDESTTSAATNSMDITPSTPRDSAMLIVIGASVGVAATLVISLAVFALICGVHQRHNRMHRRGKHSHGKKSPSMIPNPIYEPSTPIYESIEDPSWKALIKDAQSPNESKDPRYINSPPPLPATLPPHKPMAKSELKDREEKEAERIQASFCDSHQGFRAGDECYTVMNPAGTLSRHNSQVPNSLPCIGDEYVTIASAHKN